VKDLSNMDYLAVVWFALAAVGFTLLVDCSLIGAKKRSPRSWPNTAIAVCG